MKVYNLKTKEWVDAEPVNVAEYCAHPDTWTTSPPADVALPVEPAPAEPARKVEAEPSLFIGGSEKTKAAMEAKLAAKPNPRPPK